MNDDTKSYPDYVSEESDQATESAPVKKDAATPVAASVRQSPPDISETDDAIGTNHAEEIPLKKEEAENATDTQKKMPNEKETADGTAGVTASGTAGVAADMTANGTADTAAGETDTPKDRIGRVPPFSIAMFLLAGVCAVLYLIQRLNVGFSDFFNENISAFFRRILAYATCWFPFSLSEVLLILLPVAAVLLIVFVIRKKCETWRDIGRFCLILLSVVALLFNLFVLNFSAGYYASSLDEKLGLTRSPEKPEDLYRTASILAEEVNRACAELDYDGNGSSEMPYSVGEMNRLLMDAYRKASEKYDFIDCFYSRVKPVMLSEPMSYTHITGVYTFFTGEANINVHFPDYCTPFTAAHELAHQRGFAREDEANFVAFLVCIESDDAYIRYSGYLNLYEYVMSALSSADGKLYAEAYGKTGKEVHGELRAYSEFYEKYRENVVADISGAVNNSYLQSQGTVGERSYGLVVDLAVAYYRN